MPGPYGTAGGHGQGPVGPAGPAGPHGYGPSGQPSPAEQGLLTGAAYAALVFIGLILGVIGSYQYAWEIAGIPVGAMALVLVNLVVFGAAGWGMRSRLAAAAPAIPWVLVVILLSSKRPEGDLVVAGTTAGYVFIVGGAVAAVIAIAATSSARPWVTHGL